ncbi:MAG: radical SAM protein [Desulfobacteraceae bacterium]|nr:radical SAM protein [Desulfobacteraceae bacterium]
MRVLLVSANTEKINMPVLPFGLACVAAATQRAGHYMKLVNLMDQQDTRLVLKEAVKGFQPELIGISVRNIDDQCMEKPRFFLDTVREVVKDCRDLSEAPIVIGGPGYSLFPESALEYLGADMGIQGEGEMAFVWLLERLTQGTHLSGIPGLYLAGGVIGEEVRYTRDLNECPFPHPDISIWSSSLGADQEVWLPFQTRRGCPMNCSYCSTATIEGRIIRRHSPWSAVEAISMYVEAGFHNFFFVDNTFNLPASYAKELCERLAAARLKMSWRCILYPWKVDRKLVENMAKAGCKEVSLGFESGSRKILHAMNKRFQPEEVRQISDMLRDHGIRRMGFLLLGGPGETRDTVEESLLFADSLDLEAMKVTVGIRIYPYTALARTAIKQGLIAADESLLFPTFYMTSGLEDWLRMTVSNWLNEQPHWQA